MTDEELIAADRNKCIMDLTKIEKPFALLTPEEQAALQEWPHGWETVDHGGVWSSVPRPGWYPEFTYRAKPAPKRIATWHNLYSDGWLESGQASRADADTYIHPSKSRLCVYRIERNADGSYPMTFVERE